MTGLSSLCRLAALLAATLPFLVSATAEARSISSPSPYGRLVDKGFVVDAAPTEKMDPSLLRQRVAYTASDTPGTVVVDSTNRFLYLVESGGTAIRYGISVGRAGASWTGEAIIGKKSVWPRWTPPEEMIQRSPDVARYADGVAGGPANPLGARALYLFQNGRDTLFRLHGTDEWWSIGHGATAGCIRLLNQDVIDLYARVPMKARVVVRPHKALGMTFTRN